MTIKEEVVIEKEVCLVFFYYKFRHKKLKNLKKYEKKNIIVCIALISKE